MGSKLEYCFLLMKIAVVVLDIRWKMVLAWILWHVGGGIALLPTFSNSSIFQSPISNRVWILDFPIHQKSLPIAQIRPIANLYLVNYYGGNLTIPKSPNCPKFTKKSPNFQSCHQSPISKVQKLSNLKGTKPDRHSYYYFRQ